MVSMCAEGEKAQAQKRAGMHPTPHPLSPRYIYTHTHTRAHTKPANPLKLFPTLMSTTSTRSRTHTRTCTHTETANVLSISPQNFISSTQVTGTRGCGQNGSGLHRLIGEITLKLLAFDLILHLTTKHTSTGGGRSLISSSGKGTVSTMTKSCQSICWKATASARAKRGDNVRACLPPRMITGTGAPTEGARTHASGARRHCPDKGGRPPPPPDNERKAERDRERKRGDGGGAGGGGGEWEKTPTPGTRKKKIEP